MPVVESLPRTRRAVTAGCLLGLAVGWNHADVGAIASLMGDAYDTSLGMVGLFTAALFVMHAALQVPSGRAVDRVGARTIGIWALAILVASNGVALVAPDPSLALVARGLTGIGTALGFVAGIDFVRAEGGSPFAQGVYGGLSIGGAGLALAIVPQLAGSLDWRAPYVGAIVLAGTAALLLLRCPGDRHSSLARQRSVLEAAPAPRGGLLRLCVLSMATFGLSVVVGNWIVTFLERDSNLSPGTAGAIGSLALLGGIVSRPLGGWLARRHPAKNRVVVGLSFAAAAAGVLLIAAGGPLALGLAGALTLGIAAGVPFAPLFSAAARVRPEAPAAAVALVNMASNLVIVFGVPLLGVSFVLPGDGRIGFVAVAALWLGALLLVPRARELDAVTPSTAAGQGEPEFNSPPALIRAES